jgi:hypothetical protein
MSTDLVEKMLGVYGPEGMRKHPSRTEMYNALQSVAEALKSQKDRLDVLESREYQGVHVEGREYTRGQTVTHKGGIWHCNRETKQRPGECSDWTLALKAGRDGRDAR